MIRETGEDLKRQNVVRAGLLATDRTIQAGVYEKAMAEAGIELLVPEAADQGAVMEIIYDGVKAGKQEFLTGKFEKAMEHLIARGSQKLIPGCTELPVTMTRYHLENYPVVNPTMVLAQAAVNWALSD